MDADDYDVIVVGSGFGGSTAALRLTEKGYRVAVLESGRRFDEDDIPEDLVAAALVLLGPQPRSVRNPAAVAAPKRDGALGRQAWAEARSSTATRFTSPSRPSSPTHRWSHITDWRAELAPFYDQAKRMLGVVANPTMTAADEVMRAVAEEMGVAETFGPTPVGCVLR